MSSLKQIEANRRNALKSTGPTTPEGKRRSRCNAVRHGLTAETVIAALEDSEDYQAFEAAVIADYDAELAVERELVLRLASVLWRLRRATGIETALFESVTEDSRKHEHRLSRENLGEAADLAERKRIFLGAVQESDAADGNELSSDSKTDIADCFLRLADLPTFALDRLSRYEHMLWRQARQIVFTLESLRRRKRAPSRSTFPFSFRRREPGALSEGSGDHSRGQRERADHCCGGSGPSARKTDRFVRTARNNSHCGCIIGRLPIWRSNIRKRPSSVGDIPHARTTPRDGPLKS